MENPQSVSRRRGLLIAAALLAVATLALVLLLWLPGTQKPVSDTTAEFLLGHWQRPLLPQGMPPAQYHALEASLDPRACGQCHVQQYQDWRESLHSQTMGAGVLWQLRLMPPSEANQCLDCHAPLAEQKALIAQAHQWPNAPQAAAPDYVPATLGHDGLVCAACHVREHQRFGPPPRNADSAGLAAPHGGFVISEAFEDSRFCAACHQFPDDGPRTAGKLREDTLRQWQASRYPAEGQTCQSCHMPDRQHRWPGIHSQEMVRKALQVTLEVADDGQVHAQLTNAGAGHYFPTYMVPKIRAALWLLSADGGERLLTEYIIGWDVDVSLQQERFDTRIPPGASRLLIAQLPEQRGAGESVELRITVAPREHYERTYQSVLDQADKLDAETLQWLQRAYDEAVATRFEAIRLRRPLSANGH